MRERPLYGAPRIVVRRHRLLMGAVGAVGLCAGIAYSALALNPSMRSAQALVLLPVSTSSSSEPAAVDEQTQILIAISPAVLTPAGMSVSPPVSARKLAERVKVTAVGRGVLSFRAKAPNAADAVKLANALTVAYIRYVDLTRALGGAATALQPATATTQRPLPISPADGFGGLVAGLALGSVVLWKERRDWRDVQLI